MLAVIKDMLKDIFRQFVTFASVARSSINSTDSQIQLLPCQLNFGFKGVGIRATAAPALEFPK